MADLKGHLQKSGDMIRDRVYARILYLLFLWLVGLLRMYEAK